jgi:tetratricopeptide (TPR) repeat protein
MKRFYFALAIFLLVSGVYVGAQTSERGRYAAAVAASRRGDSALVIRLLEPVVGSAEFDRLERGRIWILLGSSYKAEARYSLAQRAYTNAVQLLKDDSLAAREYEVALREDGALYREMGERGAAERYLLQSLEVSKKNEDHAAVARACEGLAELSLDKRRLKDGARYIACAEAEARLTKEFDEDDQAYMSQLEALICLKKGDVQGAITKYRRSIDLFRGRYGEEFALVGWGYVLLGKAYAEGGEQGSALEAMHEGVSVLERTLGTRDPRYASAEVFYAEVLHKAGQGSAADRYRREGEATLREARQAQCSGCTMSVDALRQAGGTDSIEALR